MSNKDITLSWDDIEIHCRKITKDIKNANFEPDVIISVGRGGMVPARILSDMLGISEVHLFEIESYTGVGLRMNKPKIQPFNFIVEGKNVLVVDDLIDKGITIQATLEKMKERKVKELKTATLLCKDNGSPTSTFYSGLVDADEWVIFPWEKKEFGRAE